MEERKENLFAVYHNNKWDILLHHSSSVNNRPQWTTLTLCERWDRSLGHDSNRFGDKQSKRCATRLGETWREWEGWVGWGTDTDRGRERGDNSSTQRPTQHVTGLEPWESSRFSQVVGCSLYQGVPFSLMVFEQNSRQLGLNDWGVTRGVLSSHCQLFPFTHPRSHLHMTYYWWSITRRTWLIVV